MVISLSKQAELLNISRASLYYQPRHDPDELEVKHLIDHIYTDCPFYGYRRITEELRQTYQLVINRKRVLRLMHEMGVEAIYPKKKSFLSNPEKQHSVFPYLLKGMEILSPNHVWGTDITYIPLVHGFAYMVALMDWFSRFIIAWKMSPHLHIEFCLENLERALALSIPQIHNSDQGSHFTSPRYTDLLTARNVQISMDGRGRCMDNIFTERFWRTLKYENIYIHSYENYDVAHQGITEYVNYYNYRRRHSALEYHTPAEVYYHQYALKKSFKPNLISPSNLSTFSA